ncbi:GNAT family N-acetyltransferase [Curvivirga sp.]|uniref:GNAT family N-acetyltransferase n=1 Tax=Curvivirga sp. TaxID=2856848 RepID=UPI003B595053
MEIKIDDLSGDEIKNLLQVHLDTMASISPPESCHALDLDGLRHDSVTFWTVWEENELVGCGALKELGNQESELKSMHTPAKHRGKGIAAKLVSHIIETAKSRRLTKISLETGAQPEFKPARDLYSGFGFIECPPFGEYIYDPNSTFMSLDLAKAS